jgi:UDP-glucuronate 4-epimerase
MPVTALRFFTVYGPWGRPDMAYFKFTKAVLEGKPIDVYNSGNMERDFTYVDDIVTGVIKVCALPPEAPADGQAAPYQLFNIGNNQPVKLSKFIREIEDAAGKKALINNMPMQPGDVIRTCASIDKLRKMTGFKPRTPLREGIKEFVKWYKAFYPGA